MIKKITKNMFPLHDYQSDEWYEMHEGNNSNISAALTIHGKLHKEKFLKIIEESPYYFPSFLCFFPKKTYIDIDEMPYGHISPFKNTNFKCHYLNLHKEYMAGDHSPESFWPIVKTLNDKNYKKIDKTKNPPIACILIKAKEDLFFFSLKINHIIFDGFSFIVFLRYLLERYKDNHSAFMRYQNIENVCKRLYDISDAVTHRNKEYYYSKEYLSLASSDNRLFPLVSTAKKKKSSMTFSNSTAQSIKKQSKSTYRTTVDILISTAIVIYLHYKSNKDHVSWGHFVNSRPKIATKEIGLFANYAVNQVEIQADDSPVTLAAHIGTMRKRLKNSHRFPLGVMFYENEVEDFHLPDVSIAQTMSSTSIVKLFGKNTEYVEADNISVDVSKDNSPYPFSKALSLAYYLGSEFLIDILYNPHIIQDPESQLHQPLKIIFKEMLERPHESILSIKEKLKAK